MNVTNLRDSLRLQRLLGLIGLHALSFKSFGLFIHFVIVAKQVNFVVVLGRSGSSSTSNEGFPGFGATGKRGMLRSVGFYVVVPARRVRILGGGRSAAQFAVDVYVCLRRGISRCTVRVDQRKSIIGWYKRQK